jgi:hypothetical protein
MQQMSESPGEIRFSVIYQHNLLDTKLSESIFDGERIRNRFHCYNNSWQSPLNIGIGSIPVHRSADLHERNVS